MVTTTLAHVSGRSAEADKMIRHFDGEAIWIDPGGRVISSRTNCHSFCRNPSAMTASMNPGTNAIWVNGQITFFVNLTLQAIPCLFWSSARRGLERNFESARHLRQTTFCTVDNTSCPGVRTYLAFWSEKPQSRFSKYRNFVLGRNT